MKLPKLLLAVLCLAAGASAQTPEPPPRYRLYKTENVWTQVLLDTRTGRAWQVSISVDKDALPVRLPINESPLVGVAPARDGRYSLSPTGNMWNFIMLDEDEGYVYQLQFSMKSQSERGILLITTPKGDPR